MRRLLVLLGLLLLRCGEPSIVDVNEPRGVIEGTLVYPNGAARGNVYIFLYRRDDPPPPTGFGRPVGFVAVARETLFRDAPAGQRETFSARFSIPSVPAGQYELRAFLDADGDFNPSYELLAQPTAKDVVGGALDASGKLVTIDVHVGTVTTNGVIVTLARELPVERPAFRHASPTGFEVPLPSPRTLLLESTSFERDNLQMEAADSGFLVQFVGFDAEGRPLDADHDHLPDLYPRVLLRRIEVGTSTRSIIVPLIANPLPFLDGLFAAGSVVTPQLELIVPPIAVELVGGAVRRLPNVPPGDYETIVLSGTGQTWRVPNDLETVFPGTPEPSQQVVVRMNAGPALPAGQIRGRVLVPGTTTPAEAFVFAFPEANPPPPLGTGRPVGAGLVARVDFAPSRGGLEAEFEISGLPPGRYHLVGLFDGDDDFSPLVDWLSEPGAGDFVGRSTTPVEVDGVAVALTLDTQLRFDRPGFSLVEDAVVPSFAPSRLLLSSKAEPLLGLSPELTRFEVTRRGLDETGDNLPELYPRVLLTRLEDTEDPRTARDQEPLVVVPALVDPMPYLTALDAGETSVVTDALPIILPPVSVESGALALGIPEGRYRITLIAASGQTWRLPNASALALGRADDANEDTTQARFVRAETGVRPLGRIQGRALVPGALPPTGSVVIFAFSESSPPPPAGAGRPAAVTRLLADQIESGTATYELSGLATGRYFVRAFIDRDGDLVPWYETHEQPTAGDVPGGYLEEGILTAVAVDGLGAPTQGIDVGFIEAAAYPYDRPLFELPPDLVLDPAGPPLSSSLSVQSVSSALLRADGAFPIRWVDLDGDQIADDVNGDGAPDVFPLVIAQRLDETDPERLRLAASGEQIFGIVPVAQFAGLGFPVLDTTATSTVVLATSLNVVFPPIARNAAGDVGPPAAGEYRVSLVNDRGQTWTVPNVMQRATLDPIQIESSRFLRVRAP